MRKRNVALSVIFSIITCGVYAVFWLFEIDKETKALVKKTDGTSSCKVVFFSIITFGIYSIYWAYKTGKLQTSAYGASANNKQNLHITYLVISLLAVVVPIFFSTVVSGVFNSVFHNTSTAVSAISTFLNFVWMSVFGLVLFGKMQANVNQLLQIAANNGNGEIYVKNSSILNRPIASVLLLFGLGYSSTAVAEGISGFVLSIFGYSTTATSGNVDEIVENAVADSAYKITHALDFDVVVPNIISIAVALLFLWYFVMLFRHYKYNGVLNVKNFWSATALMTPSYFMVLLNVISLFTEGFGVFNLGIVIMGFVPGFTEEIMFRGLIIPNTLRIFNTKGGIYAALFISAGLFGLAHATNVLAGADPGTTAFQVFYTFGFGVICGAALIRTGNMWGSIICHGLMDMFAMMSTSALEQGAVQTQAFE